MRPSDKIVVVAVEVQISTLSLAMRVMKKKTPTMSMTLDPLLKCSSPIGIANPNRAEGRNARRTTGSTRNQERQLNNVRLFLGLSGTHLIEKTS